MLPDELRKDIVEALNQWYGKIEYRILHFWQDKSTFYCAIHVTYPGRPKNIRNIEFIRLFSLSGKIQISRDNSVEIN